MRVALFDYPVGLVLAFLVAAIAVAPITTTDALPALVQERRGGCGDVSLTYDRFDDRTTVTLSTHVGNALYLVGSDTISGQGTKSRLQKPFSEIGLRSEKRDQTRGNRLVLLVDGERHEFEVIGSFLARRFVLHRIDVQKLMAAKFVEGRVTGIEFALSQRNLCALRYYHELLGF
jgi:hypothetical protein